MKCFICDGEIKDTHFVKLFGYPVCSLCFYEMGKICVDNIFYSFYMNKIKLMLENKSIH